MSLTKDEIRTFINDLAVEYYDDLYRVAARRLFNKADIQDVMSDLWIMAIKHADKLYKHANQRAWLFMALGICIKRNRSTHIVKSQKTENDGSVHITQKVIAEHPVAEIIDIQEVYEEVFYEGETFEELKAILTDTEMEYIRYAYEFDLDNEAISVLMDKNYSAVTSLGARARKKIKKFLKKT